VRGWHAQASEEEAEGRRTLDVSDAADLISVLMTSDVVKLGTFIEVVSGQIRRNAPPKAATRLANANAMRRRERSAIASRRKEMLTVMLSLTATSSRMEDVLSDVTTRPPVTSPLKLPPASRRALDSSERSLSRNAVYSRVMTNPVGRVRQPGVRQEEVRQEAGWQNRAHLQWWCT